MRFPKRLNAESRLFILHMDKYLNNPFNYYGLIFYGLFLAIKFLLFNPKKKIKQLLIAKLIVGGLQHGEPIYDMETVKEELEHEFIDIPGWLSTGIWTKLRNRA